MFETIIVYWNRGRGRTCYLFFILNAMNGIKPQTKESVYSKLDSLIGKNIELVREGTYSLVGVLSKEGDIYCVKETKFVKERMLAISVYFHEQKHGTVAIDNLKLVAKKKFVVCDNCYLCIVVPERPLEAQILASSVIRGANRQYGTIPLEFHQDVKPATRKDFDDFRLHSETYMSSPDEYDFPAE